MKRFSDEELLGKPLSAEQQQELGALADMRDEDIDLSDIPEIDFSKGVWFRGKHPRHVYLDRDVQNFLMEKAAAKGVELDRLVNDLLKRDIEAFRALSQ